MKKEEVFSINITALKEKKYEYDWHVTTENLLGEFGTGLMEACNANVHLTLNKTQTMIEAKFTVTGNIGLICDRSLEPFDYPVSAKDRVIFKYGESYQELSDEVIVVPFEQVFINFAPFIYDILSLQVPIKKLHPKFRDEEDEFDDEDTMVYSVQTDDNEQVQTPTQEDNAIDPRWEALRKLQNSDN